MLDSAWVLHSRGVRLIIAVIVCTAGVITLWLPGASAAPPSENTVQVVNVHVGGYLDPHNEALITGTLSRAQKQGATLFVLQLDSDGIAGGDVQRVARALSESDIVTAVWVGPTSAVYSNELDALVRSVDFAGAANKKLERKSKATMVAPSVREFYAQLDEKKVDRLDFTLDMGCSREETKNATAKNNPHCRDITFEKNEQFRLMIVPQFDKLSPVSNLAHSLIKPGFSVGLLVMGLCLLAFEFFAASVGVAAIAGACAVAGGVYGLSYLPTHWWSVALVVAGIGALVVDVQAGGVGLYTCVGAVMVFFGALFATERGGSYEVGIAPAVIITVMALLFAVGAIPSLIRTRFGTPTIGREDFIGEHAFADGDVNPEGSVKLRGASWKARTNHATPLVDGQECAVVSIEGIVLNVEPLEGAAKDYREKRSKNS